MNPSDPKSQAVDTQLQAVCLALVAGFLDGYAYLAFKTYVSFMSGNTTFAGLKSGQGEFAAARLAGAAIGFFLAGSFAGNWGAHSKSREARRLLFGAAALLLAAAAALNLPGLTGVAFLSFAMGLVNPALSQVRAESVSLTFVTGTLNKIGSHLALAARGAVPADAQGVWDTHGYRARIEAWLWVGFFSGAVLSGMIAPHLGALTLALPGVALLFFAFTSRDKPS